MRVELRIDDVVVATCDVAPDNERPAYPWRATDDAGHDLIAVFREAAALAVLAEQLDVGDSTWAALGGAER